jgi:hypothetical protein
MSRYFNYTGDDYVAHFGIKGMKWGVRRYQNNDGSLTSAGKSRYNKKSDHQLKLEAKYQQKGKTKEEAEAAAKKRVKIEKTIAASAGIALGAAATVALIKKYKGYADDIIVGTKDQPIYRMELMNDAKDHDMSGAIYGVYKKKDTPQYFGVLAKLRNTQAKNTHEILSLFGDKIDPKDVKNAHAMKIVYDSGVKMASTKNSRKIFKNLMKNDPTFARNVYRMSKSVPFDPNTRDEYDRFVRDLAGTGLEGTGRNSEAAKQFFGELSKHGYGAIHDSNDAKFSGYGAKSAGIFFKDGYNWTAKKLSDQEIEDNAKIGQKIIDRSVFKRQVINDFKDSKGLVAVPFIALAASPAYSANTKRNRARSMKKAGVSDSDIAKQLNISEADVKKLTSNNKGYALANDYIRRYGGSKAFAMKKTR